MPVGCLDPRVEVIMPSTTSHSIVLVDIIDKVRDPAHASDDLLLAGRLDMNLLDMLLYIVWTHYIWVLVGVVLSWYGCNNGESPVQIRRCRAAVRPMVKPECPPTNNHAQPFARKGVM